MTLGFSATYLVLWAVVGLQALLTLALLQQLSKLRQLAEGAGGEGRKRLPIGSSAPDIDATDGQSGRYAALQTLGDREGVILFLSVGCSFCKELVDSMARDISLHDSPSALIVCEGGEQACGRLVSTLPPSIQVLLDTTGGIVAQYGISIFPTAVVLDVERRIRGYGHPKDIGDLKRLLSHSRSAQTSEGEVPPQLSAVLLSSR